MEDIRGGFRELRDSVGQGIRDHSLVVELRRKVEEVRLDLEVVQHYSHYLFKIYDFSNSSAFITRPPHPQRSQSIVIDSLAIDIKALVLKMLAKLVAFFNDNPAAELPHTLMTESLEMMVMVSRVLLDLNRLSDVRPIYSLVVTFHSVANRPLPPESQLAHCLNIVELISFDVETRRIDIGQLVDATKEIIMILDSQKGPEGYWEMTEYLLLQVVLKLLKKGQSNDARVLLPYLSQQKRATVSDLMSINSQTLHQDKSLKFSPFFELYLQIKDSGIQNIAQQNLKMFLSKEEHFNDIRIFDVVALTKETLPLQIWFQINLNTRAKGEVIHAGYRCFMYIMDSANEELQNSKQNMKESNANKMKIFEKLLRLSRVVMINILAEKKDNIEPIINLTKRLTKILISLTINLYSDVQAVQQFLQKLFMITSKYSLSELSRSISCIGFYYQMVVGVANQQSFNRFNKANLIDKSSELFRSLKLAYQFRSGKDISVHQQQQLLRKQPFLILLFAKEPHEQLFLRIESKEFAKRSQKWQAYLLLLQENTLKNQVYLKLLQHMEQTIINSEWSDLTKMDLSNIDDLAGLLFEKLNQNQEESNIKGNICLVLFYLVSLKSISHRLTALSGSVLLNRFSKLLKLLSLTIQQINKLQTFDRNQLVTKYVFLAKKYLCSQQETLKIQQLQSEISSEAGYSLLIDTVHELIQRYENNSQSSDFFRFVKFEILCLIDSVVDADLIYEKNAKLLKLYCSSKFIKKGLKLKLMRKLIKQDLISDTKLLTLSDLSELITISQDPKEKRIFASFIMRSFGQEGKTYLMLQNAKDPKNYGFLTDTEFDEDD